MLDLQKSIYIYAGGPGSGCRGDNCGRPSTGGTPVYHGTQLGFAKKILKEGLKAGDVVGTSHYRVAWGTSSRNIALSYAAEKASEEWGKKKPQKYCALVVVKSGQVANQLAVNQISYVPAKEIDRVEVYRVSDVKKQYEKPPKGEWPVKPVRVIRATAGTVGAYAVVFLYKHAAKNDLSIGE
jgi:hypothetical protein